MSYKKTKLIPWKLPSVEIQEDFIEDYSVLFENAQAWKIHVIFYDPVHQLHNTVADKCWIEKWTEYYLPSNTWRSRLTAMGWINPITFKFSGIVIEDYCDTESTKTALEQIRNDYPDGKPIFVILDNARYNRSNEVQEFAEKIWITLYYLPPYSPNLNLVERLRKFMKKKLVKNRYFETLSEFYDAFVWFFTNLDDYLSELTQIFSHKIQILKAV